MANPTQPFAGNPIWDNITVQTVDANGKVSPQSISILPVNQTNSFLQRITSALAGVTGFGGQPANIQGPLDVNSNPITGVTNSSPPGATEALSTESAQDLFDSRSLVKVSATYTVPTTVRTVIANGTFTVTLLTQGLEVDQTFRIVNVGAGTITVSAGGTVAINGGTSYSAAVQYKIVTFIWDGTQFWAS